jgi:hypothetical protein
MWCPQFSFVIISNVNICCPGQVHVVFVIHLLEHELSAGWVCSGHAVAGGCMFALAHDYSVMRSDKGYMFLSEVCTAVFFFPFEGESFSDAGLLVFVSTISESLKN